MQFVCPGGKNYLVEVNTTKNKRAITNNAKKHTHTYTSDSVFNQ